MINNRNTTLSRATETRPGPFEIKRCVISRKISSVAEAAFVETFDNLRQLVQTGNTALVGATIMFEILCLIADAKFGPNRRR